MIGLDTNVVLRLLVNDDESQLRKVCLFIEGVFSSEGPVSVSHVVLLETVWVLENYYRYSRAEVARALMGLSANRFIRIDDADVVHRAVHAYSTANVDFADALIGECYRARGCRSTATFDRKAAKLLNFTLIQ